MSLGREARHIGHVVDHSAEFFVIEPDAQRVETLGVGAVEATNVGGLTDAIRVRQLEGILATRQRRNGQEHGHLTTGSLSAAIFENT